MVEIDTNADWNRALQPAPLEQFDGRVADLRQLWMDVGTHLGRMNQVGELARIQWGSLAYDLVSYCAVFRAVHLDALRIHSEEAAWLVADPALQLLKDVRPEDLTFPDGLQRLAQAQITARGGEQGMQNYFAQLRQRIEVSAAASGRLTVAYKALFFFVSAYQDATYRVLLQLLGARGEGGTMKAILLNPCNPVGMLLARDRPEFADWFRLWGVRRNAIKSGVQFGISGPQWNLGVGFSRWDRRRYPAGPEAIRLADAVNALEHCVAVADLVSRDAQARSNA